jgi:hypothetical protein
MIQLKWEKEIENGVSNFRGDLMRQRKSLSNNGQYHIENKYSHNLH